MTSLNDKIKELSEISHIINTIDKINKKQLYELKYDTLVDTIKIKLDEQKNEIKIGTLVNNIKGAKSNYCRGEIIEYNNLKSIVAYICKDETILDKLDNLSNKDFKIIKLWKGLEINFNKLQNNNQSNVSIFQLSKQFTDNFEYLKFTEKKKYKNLTNSYKLNRMSDKKNYFFKYFSNITSLPQIHMLNFKGQYQTYKNIEDEYNKFNNYMPKIYYYGMYNDKNKPNNPTQYIIYKLYNTIESSTISNMQKYKLLLNSLIMLLELNKEKKILLNFNINKIGWSNDKIMNVKLIDYNYYTIYDVNDQKLLTNPDKKITAWVEDLKGESIDEPLIPKYFEGKDITQQKLTDNKYDKFSVPGLIQLINLIDFKQVEFDGIKLNKDNIIKHLKLEDPKYKEVSSYLDILKFFINIKDYIEQ
jgi:hypothetical protein